MARTGARVAALAFVRILWHIYIAISIYRCEKTMAPPKKDTTGIMLRLPAEMLKAIDDIRRQEEDIPTRPEMVRRIIAKHLKDSS